MMPTDLADVIENDVRERVESAVRDLRSYCEANGEPLTRTQLFAVASMPLRITLGLQESMACVVETYDVIQRVLPDLPAWPSEEALQEWLRDPKTTGRMQ